VQVHQRQHLGHLGALAAPGRHDGRAEAATLARPRVDPAIVDPVRLDLDPARGGGDGAGLGVAVAHDQAMALVVELAGQRFDVAGYLRFEACGEHPSGTLPDDLVQPGAHVRVGVVIGDYCQCGRRSGHPEPAGPGGRVQGVVHGDGSARPRRYWAAVVPKSGGHAGPSASVPEHERECPIRSRVSHLPGVLGQSLAEGAVGVRGRP